MRRNPQVREKIPADPDSPPLELVACGKCSAINSQSAEICVECGCWLAGPDGESPMERKLAAANALRRAYKWISGVTWLYRLGALAYGFAMVAAVFALTSPEVPVGEGILVVALTTLLAVLLLTGALQVLFRPLTWALIIAPLASAVAVVHFVGPNPLGVAFAGTSVMALLAWAAVFPVVRFHRLIEEHKDLYILHHTSGRTRRLLRGRSAQDRHERLLATMSRASRRAWKLSASIAGILVALSIVGTTVILKELRYQDFPTVRASFEEAWNASDFDEVSTFFDPRVREQQVAWLRAALAAHGLNAPLPRLENGEESLQETSASVSYWLGDITGTASWIRTEREWHLKRFELPNPPFEPVLSTFLKAWQESEAQGLAAFYSPENHESVRASLQESMRNRGWTSLPPVRKADVGDCIDRTTVVTLELDEGDVITKWHLRPDASWGLHALILPKR